jgi:sortase (surface protein transpeptidase)
VVRDATVLALPRDTNDVPGVPPATDAGRWEFGWDRPPGIRPGSAQGNVLINAHTFPDGNALGNKFLDELDMGDEIIVRGKDAELCYKVSKRIEVREADGYVPYYDREGPPQLALLVCSGKRLGPGEWTHRTIWFASPA